MTQRQDDNDAAEHRFPTEPAWEPEEALGPDDGVLPWVAAGEGDSEAPVEPTAPPAVGQGGLAAFDPQTEFDPVYGAGAGLPPASGFGDAPMTSYGVPEEMREASPSGQWMLDGAQPTSTPVAPEAAGGGFGAGRPDLDFGSADAASADPFGGDPIGSPSGGDSFGGDRFGAVPTSGEAFGAAPVVEPFDPDFGSNPAGMADGLGDSGSFASLDPGPAGGSGTGSGRFEATRPASGTHRGLARSSPAAGAAGSSGVLARAPQSSRRPTGYASATPLDDRRGGGASAWLIPLLVFGAGFGVAALTFTWQRSLPLAVMMLVLGLLGGVFCRVMLRP